MPARIRERLGKVLGYLLLLVFVLSVAAVLIPLYADYTERAVSAEMIEAASGAKAAIAEQMRRAPDGAVLNVDELAVVSPRVSYYAIDTSGRITMFSESTGVLIVLTPTRIDDRIEWACLGLPAKHVPALCRPAKDPIRSAVQPDGPAKP